MTVGERIRELREDADLKQKEVADALHITNRMMSNYERDICNPSLEYLVALSRFFTCPQTICAPGQTIRLYIDLTQKHHRRINASCSSTTSLAPKTRSASGA